MSKQSRVAVCLWFNDQAEEAAQFYTSLLANSEIQNIYRQTASSTALMVNFTLNGVPFQALNGGPQFPPSEAASIVVSTSDQAETDRLWQALIAEGGQAGQCAWLKDRFGVSWQIVPDALGQLMSGPDAEGAARVMQAMLGMQKIQISELEAAYHNKL
jgi:predicted 3-demethylubiquinone-9 3-methyltransferase (glyoxalase superfamily)